MKIRHLAFSLLPALAMADHATTVPDDEPWHPPLPEELLSPQKGTASLPATAHPVVSYHAPENEEQTWLRLFYVKETEEWPAIFRRMAQASHEKNMEMCHGYTLWLKDQELLHLRYDDDLSLSGIHADGHSYGVLYVEFSPYGIRVSPMEGYDLTGKNGGVCWQTSASKLWSWADSGQFWGELPKLLRADKGSRVTSAQDSAVKREVATKGQRMVVFWATAGYPAKAWWAAFSNLHAAVGPQRFSLIAPDGLKLWDDVVVPAVAPTARPSSAAAVPVAPVPEAGSVPKAPAAKVPAPTVPAVTPPPPPPTPAPAATAPPSAPASTKAVPAVPLPENLPPASGNPRDVAPNASVRPWAIEGNVAPVPSASGRHRRSAPASTPTAPTPATASPPPAAGTLQTAAPVPPEVEQPVAAEGAPADAVPPTPPAAVAATAPEPVQQPAAPADPPRAENAPAPSPRSLENLGNIVMP